MQTEEDVEVFLCVWRSVLRIWSRIRPFWCAEIPTKRQLFAWTSWRQRPAKLLETIQKDMLEKARAHRELIPILLQNGMNLWIPLTISQVL